MLTKKRRTARTISDTRSSMKKSFTCLLLSILGLVFLGAVYAYMYNQNSRQEEKIKNVQVMITEDSQKISAIISFINSTLAQAEQQQ